MAVLVDTRTVPPAERFDYWAAASWNILPPLRVRRLVERPFWGQMRGYQLGTVAMFRISGDTSRVIRTPDAIAMRDPEYFELGVELRGQCSLAQGDRTAVIRPGDISSWDTSEPYVTQADTPFELLVVMFPRNLIRPDVDQFSARTALRIPGDGRLASLVRSFLCQLAEGLEQGAVREDDANIGESVLDLTRGLLREQIDSVDSVRQRSNTEMTLRIRAFIGANLANPDLNPELIARAHFISARYLHKLSRGKARACATSSGSSVSIDAAEISWTVCWLMKRFSV